MCCTGAFSATFIRRTSRRSRIPGSFSAASRPISFAKCWPGRAASGWTTQVRRHAVHAAAQRAVARHPRGRCRSASLRCPAGDARAAPRDRKDVVRQIEEAAIEYYTPFDDVTSRAEEIYHRLSLGQPREEIDPRWIPGIEDSLRSAIDELPKPSRAYLASRLGVELYDQNWDAVDQKTWEEYAARQSEDLLRLDRPLEAVRLLRRRSARLQRQPAVLAACAGASTCRAGAGVARDRATGHRRRSRPRVADSGGAAGLVHRARASKCADGGTHPTADRPSSRFCVRSRSRASAFVGREPELRALSSYVFAHRDGHAFAVNDRGPGGIGKSALVVKFMLDRLKDLDLIYIDRAPFPLLRPGPTSMSLGRSVSAALSDSAGIARVRDRRAIQQGDPNRLRVIFGEIRLTRPLVVVIDEVEGLWFPDARPDGSMPCSGTFRWRLQASASC